MNYPPDQEWIVRNRLVPFARRYTSLAAQAAQSNIKASVVKLFPDQDTFTMFQYEWITASPYSVFRDYIEEVCSLQGDTHPHFRDILHAVIPSLILHGHDHLAAGVAFAQVAERFTDLGE